MRSGLGVGRTPYLVEPGWRGTAAGGMALRKGSCWGQRLNCPHLWIQLAEGRARPTQQTQLQTPQQR